MKWHWPKISTWRWPNWSSWRSWDWRFWQTWAFWWKAAVVVLAIIILLAVGGSWILPGNLFYPAKRAGESLIAALAPPLTYQKVNLREAVPAIFAARRLNEAAVMTERLDKRPVKKHTSDADTIEALLEKFDAVFSNLTVNLSQTIDRGDQPSVKIFTDLQKRSAQLAVKLEHLRLEAPPTDQAIILRSIVIVNNNLATIADVLHQPPISDNDATELTQMISSGLISKADLTALMTQANSNRRLLDLLRERVKSGQLPSGIIYAMNFDLVTKLLPDQAPDYINSVRFDELRKIALLMKAIEPTPTQKQAINQYLQSYKAGDLVPTNSLTRYTAPLIYGWHLVATNSVDMGLIKSDHLSPDRRIFYDLWVPYLTKTKTSTSARQSLLLVSPVLAQTDTVATQTAPQYDQVLASANIGIIKSSSLLDRVQLELLKAMRSEVAYMALPPGWTASDITASSDNFQAATEALRQNEAVQTKTDQATAALAAVTGPIQAADTNQAVEALRAEMKASLTNLRNQLIQTTYNSTFTTVNNTTVVNQTVSPTIDGDIDKLRSQFNQKLTDLETKLTTGSDADKSVAKQELADLKTNATTALDRLKAAQADLKNQVTAQAELITSLQKTIASLADELSTARKETADLTKTAAANLDAAISDIKQIQTGNLASLQSQLTTQVSQAGALELSLVSLAQAQTEQKAALEAEINLSSTDWAALKVQVNQVMIDLTQAQTKNVADLTAAIAAAENRGQTQIAETKQAVDGLKTNQADLLKSLQTLADDKDALRSQVTTAINDLKTAQDATNASVQKLTTDQTSLLTSVQAIAASQTTANTTLQALQAETAVLRSQLTESIVDLTAAEAASSQDLHNAILALGSQLTQSIGEVATAQAQTQARLDLVEGKTVTLGAAVDGIRQTNLQVQADLTAQLNETKATQQELSQSLVTLLQAQTQTATEIVTLKTDITATKQSVTDIKVAQVAANAKVDGLLAVSADWSNLAASVQVDIIALNNFQTQLNADFAAKSAALQVQFESYQQHLNADINRLSTETDAQILRLQQEADRLKLQLQQLQTTTGTTTTPTTTPSTPGL